MEDLHLVVGAGMPDHLDPHPVLVTPEVRRLL